MQLTVEQAVIAYDYTRTYTAQPPLLFLHGALGVRGQFDAIRQRFHDRSHIAIDFPSHGESAVTGGRMSWERIARDTLALLDALDIAQVDIVGHSMGGYVGLVMAHLAPQRVRSIVTLGTKFYWGAEVIDAMMKDLDADAIRAGSPRAFDALKAMHTASGIGAALSCMHSLIADFARWQLTEEMVRACAVPVLVSTGDHDAMVPPAEVVRLFTALDAKRCAVAILPHTPHALQKVAPDCFEAAIRQFWRSALKDSATTPQDAGSGAMR